jgi:hypothetical protein
MLFKINGERNSGTRFLSKIMIANFGREMVHIHGKYCDNNKQVLYWKHGAPQDEQKKLDDKVIDIFIFRELTSWLVSMHSNDNYQKRTPNFTDFLMKKLSNSNTAFKNYVTKLPINIDDNDKTIFDIRYFKYKQIIKYANRNKNCIFIDMHYLQNPKNCLNFLIQLNNKFHLGKSVKEGDYVTRIAQHTRTKKTGYINRNHKINAHDYIGTINDHKNTEIEEEINKLAQGPRYF